jgi:hypothetical protein
MPWPEPRASLIGAGLAALVSISFSCSSSAPAAPSGPIAVAVSGTVVSTQTGLPVPSAFLNGSAGGGIIQFADAAGGFTVTGAASTTPLQMMVGVLASRVSSGLSPPFISRTINLSLSSARSGVRIDIIEDVAPFSSTFYRQFARDARDTPPGNRTLRPWTIAPSFYIRTTHVDTGAPIPPVIIAEMERMFRNSVPELTGGRFAVATIETGPEARGDRAGWVNVLFQRVLGAPGAGGQATIGGNQGTIWLQFDPETPRLSPSSGTACAYATGAAEHEIVHTMGFYHVDGSPEMPKPFQSPDFCSGNNRPSVVRYHASIMYSRPFGNAFPDNDPPAHLHAVGSSPPVIVSCPFGK